MSDNVLIFVRADGFYPVQVLSPAKCGRSLKQQAEDHAKMNPGTLRVEDSAGSVLWRLQ